MRDRRGALRRGVRTRAWPPRRVRDDAGRDDAGSREAVPRGAAAARPDRQGRGPPRRRGRDTRAGPYPRPGRAVLAGRARGAAGPREDVPAAGPGARPRRASRDRRRQGHAADRRRRPFGRHPLARPADDHGLRSGGAGAAGCRQRRRQHGIRRPRHKPRPDDDDRHRVLRALVAGREPGAPAPDQHDPGRVRRGPVRAVRRLHRPGAVERRTEGRPGAGASAVAGCCGRARGDPPDRARGAAGAGERG